MEDIRKLMTNEYSCQICCSQCLFTKHPQTMHFTEYTVHTGKQTKVLKTNEIFRGKRCRSEKNERSTNEIIVQRNKNSRFLKRTI